MSRLVRTCTAFSRVQRHATLRLSSRCLASKGQYEAGKVRVPTYLKKYFFSFLLQSLSRTSINLQRWRATGTTRGRRVATSKVEVAGSPSP